ncbi:LAGLIDADG family homing endonuclease [Cytobacillus firmus]|uniref:Homing endonuclease LAGLIDADG domain-containing protein n=2 Tax=Cytobacillus firmus TaxID=1399 RepID=A0A800MUB0_CYTFI|nr:LAGLIDADG family homing endonuclease [Cytobacillus firmus]KAF0822601.1 hypothetical protein KIS1582_3629 [Cytobacillus firmus]
MESFEAAYIAGIIDGEGTITLTRMHASEHRRPCITIASTDKELLVYLHTLTGGTIINKKNYKPGIHKNSFSLNIKQKEKVMFVDKKRNRALWILDNYDRVTPRNGKYDVEKLKLKILFEEDFFKI